VKLVNCGGYIRKNKSTFINRYHIRYQYFEEERIEVYYATAELVQQRLQKAKSVWYKLKIEKSGKITI